MSSLLTITPALCDNQPCADELQRKIVGTKRKQLEKAQEKEEKALAKTTKEFVAVLDMEVVGQRRKYYLQRHVLSALILFISFPFSFISSCFVSNLLCTEGMEHVNGYHHLKLEGLKT